MSHQAPSKSTPVSSEQQNHSISLGYKVQVHSQSIPRGRLGIGQKGNESNAPVKTAMGIQISRSVPTRWKKHATLGV